MCMAFYSIHGNRYGFILVKNPWKSTKNVREAHDAIFDSSFTLPGLSCEGTKYLLRYIGEDFQAPSTA